MIPARRAIPPASDAAPRPFGATAVGLTGPARPQRRPSTRPRDATGLIDGTIVGLLLLAVVSIFTISSAMLTDWKIHYLTTGGSVLEKFHPATYFTCLAFCLLLIRNGDPIETINGMLADAKLLLIYLSSWFLLLLQMLALERPFTVIIDTFLLPVMLCLSIWSLSPTRRRPLVWAIHLAILLNVILGYYEYFSGHRLFALNLGANLIVHGEWRSSALLGHPLTASGVVAAYILALILRPSLCPWLALRLPLIGFCLASLMAFGGRTALITVLAISGAIAAVQILRILRGGRVPIPLVIMAICVVFIAGACIVAALDLGIFDKMLVRFGSDHGSTLARYATFDLLSHFDWYELVLSPDPTRASALQTAYGLNYGIEDFWISCIVQFGLVHTVLLSIGLVALFAEILQRASGAAWAIVILILIIAASSVSFSSKNIQLAQFVVLIALLLPRARQRVAPVRAVDGRYRPAPMSV